MQWFEGGIAEAVAASKSRNAVFVVFVEGKDDASKATLNAINSANVSSKLETSKYVAIRIESDTTAHRQFAQIYQIVPVPSLFFIGNSGLPIEVLAGATDEATLLSRLEAVEAVHEGSEPSSAARTPSSASIPGPERQATNDEASAASVSIHTVTGSEGTGVDRVSDMDADVVLPSTTAASAETAATPSTSSDSPFVETVPSSQWSSVEERVERAKELLELKRLQKMKDEQEEERRKEVERRKTGRDVQQLKRWQQDQELKQLQEQRRREREENEQARQRVLDQIAQDRANRMSQQSASSARVSSSDLPLPERSSSRPSDGTARLQFRLPDGSTHTSSFPSTATLGEVRAYLAANIDLPFRSFLLATTFPRREFQEEENASTIQDLGLVPTAVMLIIPSGGAGVVQNAGPPFEGVSEMLSNFIWSIFSPVFTVLTYARNRLFGDRGIDNRGERGASTDTSGSSSAAQAKRDKRTKRGSSSGGVIKRTGSNIHRLHQNHSSSDDDNNTWNGNSTQQM